MKAKSVYTLSPAAAVVSQSFFRAIGLKSERISAFEAQWKQVCLTEARKRGLNPRSASYSPPADADAFEVALLIRAADSALPPMDWVEALSHPLHTLSPPQQMDRIARCFSHADRIAFILVAHEWSSSRIAQAFGIPARSFTEWLRLRILEVQSRIQMHDATIAATLSPHVRLPVRCRAHGENDQLPCENCTQLENILAAVIQTFHQTEDVSVAEEPKQPTAPFESRRDDAQSFPRRSSLRTFLNPKLRTPQPRHRPLTRWTWGGQAIVSLGFISVIFWGAPKLRKLVVRDLERKASDISWMAGSTGPTPTTIPPLNQNPPNVPAQSPEQLPTYDPTTTNNNHEPRSSPGPNELWRFNLRTERARDLRMTVGALVERLQGQSAGSTDDVRSTDAAIESLEAPGGFQFRLTLPRSRVLELWHELSSLAASEEAQTAATQTTPKSQPTKHNKTALTWFRNRTQKKLNHDQTAVVVWLSYL